MSRLLIAALALAMVPAIAASELPRNDTRGQLEQSWRDARESIQEELELSGLTKVDQARAFARMIDLSLNHRKSFAQEPEKGRDDASSVAGMLAKYDRIVAPELERLRVSQASATFIREQFTRWLQAQSDAFALLKPELSTAPDGE